MMKTFRHILLFLQAAILLGLTACHDDFGNNFDDDGAYTPQISTGIVLKIPNLNQFATRAVANTCAGEGTVKDGDIHLFLFNQSGGPDVYLHLGASDFDNAYSKLPSLDKDGNEIFAGARKVNGVDGDYVEVPMYPGKYKLYILANMTDYAYDKTGTSKKTISAALTEQEIKDMTLKFPGPIAPGNLPMYCPPGNVKVINNSNSQVSPANGEIDILSSDVKTIQAHLQFQCAKVRYTVLFDNTVDGDSYEQFKDKYFIDIPSASVSNIAQTMKADGSSHSPEYLFKATDTNKSTDFGFEATTDPAVDASGHFATKYPTCPAYPFEGLNGHEGDFHKENNLDRLSDSERWTSENQRAWQGVIYLPENKSTTTRTTINLDAVAQEKKADGTFANVSDNPYTISLISGTSDGSDTQIERGNFYDIRAIAKGLQKTDITFEVTEWIPKQFLYDLQTPVYLDVESTHITVSAGSETAFEFSTNGVIGYDSPKWFNDETGDWISFYDVKFNDGKVVVTVNSKIPASALTEINKSETEKEKYMYFHLTSGNIRKKITVDPLNIGPFLMVDPDLITINVREQIGNGQYDGLIGNGAFEIHVRTNLDAYTVTAENWNELVGVAGGNISDILYLVDENNNKIEFDQPRTVSGGGETLYLVYDKLNGGEPFWTQDSHEMGLNFSVSESTVPDCYTFIQTYPSTDKYIIHMKCASNWDTPHVYAYQCLEIPGWYDKDNYKYANKPVGYDYNGYVAALEYSYTGKVSFKGWDNASSLLTGNWDWKEGFYIIQDLYIDQNTTSSTYYDLTYDFMAEYRTATKEDGSFRCPCSDCRAGLTKNLWPGIAMESEGDDWYRIELPGTAVPGRTLLMFNDHHDSDQGRRYPGSLQVGVPLFDYPTREGWINLTTTDATHAFTPNDIQTPDNTPTSGTQTFRIIWHKKYGETICNRIKINSPSEVAGTELSPRGVMNGDSNLLYYDVRVNIGSTITYQLYKEGSNTPESKVFSVTKNNFTWNKKYKRFELTDYSHL